MKQYLCETESGHRVIIHGNKALAEYRSDVAKGDAERLLHVEQVDLRKHRDDHEYLWEQGLCYGPCSLAE